MASPPTGTVAFMFTDIEVSIRMWERHPEAMYRALSRHDEILREATQEREGHVFKTVGDASCCAFPTAPDALEAQRGLLSFFPGVSFNTLARDVPRSDNEIRRAVQERLPGL